MPISRFFLLLPVSLAVCLPIFSGRAGDGSSAPSAQIVVSISEQKLALVCDGEVLEKYPISTSRFGLGDACDSYRTPLGRLAISEKIGGGLPAGSVLKGRRPTGEILKPNTPGRDPIVSRILWLDGQESRNRNAHERCVYIHGTPDEKHLGRPVSYGCIRMRSSDVIELYAAVPVGTEVSIVRERLPGSYSLFATLFDRDGAGTNRSGVQL